MGATLTSCPGCRFLSTNEPECALADAEMALRYRPDWGKAHFRYGEACEMMHRYDDARGAYTQALHFDPNDPTWKQALYDLLDKLSNLRRCAQYIANSSFDPQSMLSCMLV